MGKEDNADLRSGKLLPRLRHHQRLCIQEDTAAGYDRTADAIHVVRKRRTCGHRERKCHGEIQAWSICSGDNGKRVSQQGENGRDKRPLRLFLRGSDSDRDMEEGMDGGCADELL